MTDNKQKLLHIGAICMSIYLTAYLSLLTINDYYFRDDNVRLEHGATYFTALSRWISHYGTGIFSLSRKAFDFSPLSQILSLLFITLAGLIILSLFKKRYHLVDALPICVLGLFPFFWENISYTYDSIFMGLSILFAVIPFLWLTNRFYYFVISSLSILGVLMTYQLSIGIYPIVVIFLTLDNYFIKQNQQETIKVLFVSIISFVTSMIFYRLFIYKPYHGHIKTDTDLINQDWIQNFFDTFFWIIEVIPLTSGLFWLLLGIFAISIVTFVISSKQKNWSFICIVIAILVTLVFSINVQILYGRIEVYRYYTSFIFLVMLLSVYSFSLIFNNDNKYIQKLLISFFGIVIMHLSFVTSAFGNATQLQWQYDKYRLTLVVNDLLEVIGNTDNYKVNFSKGNNLMQEKVTNIKHKNKIYYDFLHSNLDRYGSTGIINRFFPLQKGNPQCKGDNKLLIDNMFHTITVQGNCYSVEFNSI